MVPLSVAVLAQGLNKHGWFAQQGQVSDRVVLDQSLFARCVPQFCWSDETIQSLRGARKASPFRRIPCTGPVGPSSVPEWTVFGLRELIPLALAQLGPGEFGLGLCPLSSSGKVSGSPWGSCALEGPPKVGGHLVAQLFGSQAEQTGLNPGCLRAPLGSPRTDKTSA